jgi:hypothetical protein
MNYKSLRMGRLYTYFHQLSSTPLTKKIFFLHVPKCGGSSIDVAIRNSFGAISSNQWFHLNPQASLKASQVAKHEEAELLENILLYYMSVPQCRYISGHFAYSEKAVERFKDEWSLITLLRHPVSKWFSKYFYNRYKTHSTHYKLECDLNTYVASETAIADGSDYVRCFAEAGMRHKSTSDEAVNEAIANLNNFNLVGVLEHVDSFSNEYQSLFDVKLSIGHERRNPLPKSRQEEQITDEIRERVTEICQPDLKVYEAALKRVKNYVSGSCQR